MQMNIEKEFNKMKTANPKKAVEIAYAAAIKAIRDREHEKAKIYTHKCLSLIETLNPQTAEECATSYSVINGVALPEFIHIDLVRDRLKHYLH